MHVKTAPMVALAALLCCAPGCRRQPTHARVDAAIAPLIPADTVALAGLRLDRLQKTAFFRDYVAAGRLPGLERLKEQTGLDPAKDIWELVWAQGAHGGLLFIRGKFGGEFGLEPKFDVPGLQRRSYKGYYILEQQGRGVLFFNTGVAVAGRVEELEAVVDNRDKASELPPAELLAMVETLAPDHAWMVARGSAAALGAAGQSTTGNLGHLTAAMGPFKAHADLSDGLALEAQGDYPDAAQARQAQDTIRAFVAVAKLRAGEAEWKALCEGIEATAEAATLRVKLRVPADRLAGVLAAWPGAAKP